MILDLILSGATQRVEITRLQNGEGFLCKLNGRSYDLEVRELQPGVVSLLVEGKAYRCILEETVEGACVLLHGQRFPYSVEDPRSLRSRRSHGASADGPKPVRAPMPGRVVRVLVEAGADVDQHQGIVVIEAMKMQNELKSPKAGKVVRIHVAPGDTVQSGDVLAIIE